jgi:hypothetical protein
MPTIFISYRRSDSQDVTGRIYDRLVGKFTKEQVLKDVDNIPLGVSFPLHLQQMLRKADVVLVIIGPAWTTATDAKGRRRLDDPNDFVRVEVEAALRGKIPVIPILVSNATMPQVDDLPKSMQALASRNGMPVRPDPDFNNDIARLFSGIDHLEKLLNPPSGKSAKEKKEEIPAVIPVKVQEAIVVELAPSPVTVKPITKPKAKERPSAHPDANDDRGRDERPRPRRGRRISGRGLAILFVGVGAVALVLFSGIGIWWTQSGPTLTAAIEGDVTLNGTLLPRGTIVFTPVDTSKGAKEVKVAIERGHYSVGTRRGPYIGFNKVQILGNENEVVSEFDPINIEAGAKQHDFKTMK